MTKLNSYILTDEVKRGMRNKLSETQQDKKEDKEELGFTLCVNSNNIISARGNHLGYSGKIIINPDACNEDEKFLGGYHTHPNVDSHASANDLVHCGTNKIVCIGGDIDNKIKCYVWKSRQLSSEDKGKIADGYISGHRNPKYQQTFNCIDNFEPLYREEKDIKEIDKGLKELESGINRDIISAVRNLRVGILKQEIKNKSKKYYNEVEIK